MPHFDLLVISGERREGERQRVTGEWESGRKKGTNEKRRRTGGLERAKAKCCRAWGGIDDWDPGLYVTVDIWSFLQVDCHRFTRTRVRHEMGRVKQKEDKERKKKKADREVIGP